MSRKVFDILASSVGLVLVVVLLAAGGLLTWGSSFADSNVHNQLAQQQIFFPTKAQLAHPDGREITTAMVPYLSPYAGQQVLTGAQAETYADHFMKLHLAAMPYGGVYSKVSAASRANPSNKQLAALVQTVFQGTTLRGLLLEAYGFATIGTVMFWGSIASFILAAVMALFVLLGFMHASRTAPEEELLAKRARRRGFAFGHNPAQAS